MLSIRSVASAIAPAILAFAFSTDDAAASCGRPAEAFTVPPPLGVRAPRNVRPRVKLHVDWRTNAFCVSWGSVPPCTPSKGRRFDLELRVAGGTGREPIPTSLRESPSGELTTVEIIPRAPLLANARFEIIEIELDGKEAPRIIGTFATGDTIDEKAPTFKGVTNHRLTMWPSTNKTTKSSRGVITIEEQCGSQGIDFFAPEFPTDEGGTRLEDIRYGIWIGEPGKDIDYTSPPRTYAKGSPPYSFRPNSQYKMSIPFGTTDPTDFSFPVGKRAVKFGFRAIDLAGNQSTLSEIVVDVP